MQFSFISVFVEQFINFKKFFLSQFTFPFTIFDVFFPTFYNIHIALNKEK